MSSPLNEEQQRNWEGAQEAFGGAREPRRSPLPRDSERVRMIGGWERMPQTGLWVRATSQGYIYSTERRGEPLTKAQLEALQEELVASGGDGATEEFELIRNRLNAQEEMGRYPAGVDAYDFD